LKVILLLVFRHGRDKLFSRCSISGVGYPVVMNIPGGNYQNMAGRGRSFRLETEIEKSREESNWKKVVDLAEQLKLRSPDSGEFLE